MRTITESESTPGPTASLCPPSSPRRIACGWAGPTAPTPAHGAKPAQKQYAAIARAIAEFTPVYMCANQVDYANCKAVFENDENVTVIEMTTDDAWFRGHRRHLRHQRQGREARQPLALQRLRRSRRRPLFPVGQGRADRPSRWLSSGCRRYRPDDDPRGRLHHRRRRGHPLS